MVKIQAREMGALNSILIGIAVLLGEQGKDWEYFENCISPEWIELRLWLRRN